ncbi:GNAT family N-acetyltransferase [Pseudomonas daroniae]|uniref:GNAT family N-acetyltransferase n=1 Tax=Phytopseudomonas daroniae TaxID=2487519 RepID=A0A4Q9QPR7_9GAMM|nr:MULTISPECIES: GNAT family N-acetyltransferase [Pseudomonas]TBU82125.1 GNAT family N-acetyltransferase [Pseudomonas daroniae]TBU84539.1 GNAT family N-acetyltransferase [Pseudomonas sp. FRB 228]TBU92426.1 GNAT family N-acetyltransferase [Pseudomonas daroniae]
MNTSPIHIARVQASDIAELVDFVMAARAEIFPMLDATVLPADLQYFEQVYLNGEDGCFWLARCDDEIVAAVGYLPYDHRFPQLDYAGRRTVEIVRLFVAPQFRRFGLARALYARLHEHAADAGVQVLYLHTHPFLPGAIRFWEKQGFAVVDVEADPLWQTTHMQCLLPDLS